MDEWVREGGGGGRDREGDREEGRVRKGGRERRGGVGEEEEGME